MSDVTGAERPATFEDIRDENILRELWLETEDPESKRHIRARMCRLRDERLKELYEKDDIIDNILQPQLLGDESDSVFSETSETDEDFKAMLKARDRLEQHNRIQQSYFSETAATNRSSSESWGGHKSTPTEKVGNTKTKQEVGTEEEEEENENKKIIITRTTTTTRITGGGNLEEEREEELQVKSDGWKSEGREEKSETFNVGHSVTLDSSRRVPQSFEEEEQEEENVGIIKNVSGRQDKSSSRRNSGSKKKTASETTATTKVHNEVDSGRRKLSNEMEMGRGGGGGSTSVSSGSKQSSSTSRTTVSTSGRGNRTSSPDKVESQPSSAFGFEKREISRAAGGQRGGSVERERQSPERDMVESRTTMEDSTDVIKSMSSIPVLKSREEKRGGGGGSGTVEGGMGETSTINSNLTIKSKKDSITSTSNRGGEGEEKTTASKNIGVNPTENKSRDTRGSSPSRLPRRSTTSATREIEPRKDETVTLTSSSTSVKASGAVRGEETRREETEPETVIAEESIIRELDSLDNFLSQRSSSMEEQPVTTTTTTVISVGGGGESSMKMDSASMHSQRGNRSEIKDERRSLSLEEAEKSIMDVMESGVEKPFEKRIYKYNCPDDHGPGKHSHHSDREGDTGDSNVINKVLPPQADSEEAIVNEIMANINDYEKSEQIKATTGGGGGGGVDGGRGRDAPNVKKAADRSKVKSKSSSPSPPPPTSRPEPVKEPTVAAVLAASTTESSTSLSRANTRVSKVDGVGGREEREKEKSRGGGGGDGMEEPQVTKSRSEIEAARFQSKEKYDADILSRPSVFHKKKSPSPSRPEPNPRQRERERKSLEKSPERMATTSHQPPQHQPSQQRSSVEKRASPPNHKELTVTDNNDNDSGDDDPLKPPTRFSRQSKLHDGPGAVLLAKNLFEAKSKELAESTGRQPTTTTTGKGNLRVSKKTAMFEARSRGERVSISSESSHAAEEKDKDQKHSELIKEKENLNLFSSSSPVVQNNKQSSVTISAAHTATTITRGKTSRKSSREPSPPKNITNTEKGGSRKNSGNISKSTIKSAVSSETTEKRSKIHQNGSVSPPDTHIIDLENKGESKKSTYYTPPLIELKQIELMEDLTKLELLLEKATNYNERSQIRGRIRTLKRKATMEKNAEVQEKRRASQSNIITTMTTTTMNTTRSSPPAHDLGKTRGGGMDRRDSNYGSTFNDGQIVVKREMRKATSKTSGGKTHNTLNNNNIISSVEGKENAHNVSSRNNKETSSHTTTVTKSTQNKKIGNGNNADKVLIIRRSMEKNEDLEDVSSGKSISTEGNQRIRQVGGGKIIRVNSKEMSKGSTNANFTSTTTTSGGRKLREMSPPIKERNYLKMTSSPGNESQKSPQFSLKLSTREGEKSFSETTSISTSAVAASATTTLMTATTRQQTDLNVSSHVRKEEENQNQRGDRRRNSPKRLTDSSALTVGIGTTMKTAATPSSTTTNSTTRGESGERVTGGKNKANIDLENEKIRKRAESPGLRVNSSMSPPPSSFTGGSGSGATGKIERERKDSKETASELVSKANLLVKNSSPPASLSSPVIQNSRLGSTKVSPLSSSSPPSNLHERKDGSDEGKSLIDKSTFSTLKNTPTSISSSSTTTTAPSTTSSKFCGTSLRKNSGNDLNPGITSTTSATTSTSSKTNTATTKKSNTYVRRNSSKELKISKNNKEKGISSSGTREVVQNVQESSNSRKNSTEGNKIDTRPRRGSAGRGKGTTTTSSSSTTTPSAAPIKSTTERASSKKFASASSTSSSSHMIPRESGKGGLATDSVTSSYGIGPSDEDGAPLFGLSALRKVKQAQEKISQQAKVEKEESVSTTTKEAVDNHDRIESSKIVENNLRHNDMYGLRALRKAALEVGGGSSTVSQADKEKTRTRSPPKEFNTPSAGAPVTKESCVISSSKQQQQQQQQSSKTSSRSTGTMSSIKSESVVSTGSAKTSDGNRKTIGRLSHRLSGELDLGESRERTGGGGGGGEGEEGKINRERKSPEPPKFIERISRERVGRSSVREMSKRFEGGGLSSGSGDSSSFMPSRVTVERSIRTVQLRPSSTSSSSSTNNTKDNNNREIDGGGGGRVDDKTRGGEGGKGGSTFLSDRSPVQNVSDLLARMRSSEGEDEGRNLLNKFLGAQILLEGAGQLLSTSAMLDQCKSGEERGGIENRLKILDGGGETGVKKTTTTTTTTTSAAATGGETILAASADLTGELMPLILGQLQSSLDSFSALGGGGGGGGDNINRISSGNGDSKIKNKSQQQQQQQGDDDEEEDEDDEDEEDADDECLTSPLESEEEEEEESDTEQSSVLQVLDKTVTAVEAVAATATAPTKEFSSFIEGIRNSLQNCHSTLTSQNGSGKALNVLGRGGKGEGKLTRGNCNQVSTGGGGAEEDRGGGVDGEKKVETSESDLIQQVDSVLTLLRNSLLADPNCLSDRLEFEKSGGKGKEDRVTKGKELIALIDRLKTSLLGNNSNNKCLSEESQDSESSVSEDEEEQVEEVEEKEEEKKIEEKEDTKSTTILESSKMNREGEIFNWQESRPPDLVPLNMVQRSGSNTWIEKFGNGRGKGLDKIQHSGGSQDSVPWKVRAGQKRNKGRSHTVGVSEEELKEARLYLQQEAFKTALKEKQQEKMMGGELPAALVLKERQPGEQGKLVDISTPPIIPLSPTRKIPRRDEFEIKRQKIIPRPFLQNNNSSNDGTVTTTGISPIPPSFPQTPSAPEYSGNSSNDENSGQVVTAGLKLKPFRTLSLDSNYDPSKSLFTPEETVQIAIHKAAIKKQMSEEEDRRKRRNSLSSYKYYGDFPLGMPKPYAPPSPVEINTIAGNNNNNNKTNYVQHSPLNTSPQQQQSPPQQQQQQQQDEPICRPMVEANERNDQVVLFTNSQLSPLINSPNNNSNNAIISTNTNNIGVVTTGGATNRIENVQISLKELNSSEFPQLQIAITLNTNNSPQQQQGGQQLQSQVVTLETSPHVSIEGNIPLYSKPNNVNNCLNSSDDNNTESSKGNRYRSKKERKKKMKRANTIDIPHPPGFLLSQDPDSDLDDDPDDDFDSSTPFKPKTEGDRKFLAFLEKNNALEANKPSLRPNYLTVNDKQWNNRFFNLKTSFESSSQGSSPSLSPVPIHKPRTVAEMAMAQSMPKLNSPTVTKPVWATSNSPGAVPPTVKNKLHVFEAHNEDHHNNHNHTQLWRNPAQGHYQNRNFSQSNPSMTSSSAGHNNNLNNIMNNNQVKRSSFFNGAAQSQPNVSSSPPVIPRQIPPGPLNKSRPVPPPPQNIYSPEEEELLKGSESTKVKGHEGVHMVHATASAMQAMNRQPTYNIPPVVPLRTTSSTPPLQQQQQQLQPPPRPPPSNVEKIEKMDLPWTKKDPDCSARVMSTKNMFENKQSQINSIPHPAAITGKLKVAENINSLTTFKRNDGADAFHKFVPQQQSQQVLKQQQQQQGGIPKPVALYIQKTAQDNNNNKKTFPQSTFNTNNSSRVTKMVQLPQQPSQQQKTSILRSFGTAKSFDDTHNYSNHALEFTGGIGNNNQTQVIHGPTHNNTKLDTSKHSPFVNVVNPAKVSISVIPKTNLNQTGQSQQSQPQQKSTNIQSPQQQQQQQPHAVIVKDSSYSDGLVLSPVVSKVMGGAQQQRATITQREVTSLHDGNNNNNSQSNRMTSARSNISSLLNQYQSTPPNVVTTPNPVSGVQEPSPIPRRLKENLVIVADQSGKNTSTTNKASSTSSGSALSKSLSGDAITLLQSKFRQPQQPPPSPVTQPVTVVVAKKPVVNMVRELEKSQRESTNPAVPRQRSLSEFPRARKDFEEVNKRYFQPQSPSHQQGSNTFTSTFSSTSTTTGKSLPDVQNLTSSNSSTGQSTSTTSISNNSEQIQRTASGSSIFDRAQSLYISVQDLPIPSTPRKKPPSLPRSQFVFPKQFEAQMSPGESAKKEKELEAYFKGKGGSTKQSQQQIRKSASHSKIMHRQRSNSDGEEDVDQIFESLFKNTKSVVESTKSFKSAEIVAASSSSSSPTSSTSLSEFESKSQIQQQQQQRITAESKAVMSSSQSQSISTSTKTASSSMSSSSTSSAQIGSSPFNKFKQMDQQTNAGNKKGNQPLFKFNQALNPNSAKEVLLYWVQCRTRDYQIKKVENFSSDWSDGLAFCALIHHFYPDAFDFNALSPKNRQHNFELAFKVAEEKADIYPLLDVEDMVTMGSRPDWKCVFTYVQSMYRKLKDLS